MVQITNMHSLEKTWKEKMPLAAVTFFATTNGKYQILGVKFAIDIQVYQARLFASLFFETFSAFSFKFVRQNTFLSI